MQANSACKPLQGCSDRVRSRLLLPWELVAASEIGLQDKVPPNLHCPLVAMHHPCALAGLVGTGAGGVGALSGELTCHGESATPLSGQPPLPFFPKPISPDVVCVSVPQALSNYSFRVALFLAKTDHLPRKEKCTKPCNLLTSVTSVRNYQHKTSIFFLDLFYSNTYLCLFAKVSFIAIATMLLNIFLTGNLSCF